MTKLTERFKTIAGEIRKGETAADIGTDHGYLPLYLYEKKISPKVIMTDLSPHSLNKAKTNFALVFPGRVFDLRVGDGLDVLAPGEVDNIVAAGMGGLLIKDMLDWDIGKTRSFRRLILQPRNNVGRLMRWLDLNGFDVTKYQIVKEAERYCEIITASPGTKNVSERSEAEYDFPDLLMQTGGPLTTEYLRFHLNRESVILNKTTCGRTSENDGDDPVKSIRFRRIERIRELLTETEL